jgi:hypothetical protein
MVDYNQHTVKVIAHMQYIKYHHSPIRYGGIKDAGSVGDHLHPQSLTMLSHSFLQQFLCTLLQDK